jgi:hypothetical protein
MTTFPDTTYVVFLQELVEDAAAVDALWGAVGVSPAPGAHRLATAVNRSDGPRPALTGELCDMVRAYYETSDRELASLLGRPLPW